MAFARKWTHDEVVAGLLGVVALSGPMQSALVASRSVPSIVRSMAEHPAGPYARAGRP